MLYTQLLSYPLVAPTQPDGRIGFARKEIENALKATEAVASRQTSAQP
jgi:uncharacterized protein Smg (DUF494 family)